jgi:putative DNA-invertase from lambdoid prophage Rac
MEVILYARSAMEDPCDPQCPKQLQDCRDYVQSKGWSISAEYCDPGVAGTPGVQKKGLATAIAALRAGSVLLVIGVNRLSRDSRELDSLLMRVKSLGARVIGVEDAFDSNHASPFLTVMTGLDDVAKNWSLRIRRGLEQRRRKPG